MEDIKKKVKRIKRKIQIGAILFISFSVIGYIYHPILTAIADVIVLWSIHLWTKRMGIKTTYFKKKK